MHTVKKFKNLHDGEICIIMGNGPSLKEVDLESLDGYVTFGLNLIYKKEGAKPTYHVSVNDLVLDQFADEMIEAMPNTPKFITHRKKDLFEADPNVIPINTNGRKPEFSKDMMGKLWEGHTVTFVALQLAYYMGFSRVILVGLDHYFKSKGTPNERVLSVSEDVDHFTPDYFGPGVEWNLPDLEKSELAYSLAKNAYVADGREIVNASHRTALKTFPLMNPNRLPAYTHPRVSAIVSAYHAERFIEGCLQDLMDQTMWESRDLEIVVVCQEGSAESEIAYDYWKSFHNGHWTLVETEGIPTVYRAWNLGIERATGKYFTNANTDDRHNPISFELQAEILDANEHIDLVYHNQYITWEPNTTWKEFVSKDRELVGGRVEGRSGIFAWSDYSKNRLIQGCFIGPQPMWRATLHQQYGGFNEDYESAGDYEFWLRIAKEDNMFHISEPLGLYLASPEGIEMSNPELNAQESIFARTDNGVEGLMSQQLARNMIMLMIGGEYVVTNYESIMGLVRHIDKTKQEHTVDIKSKQKSIAQRKSIENGQSKSGEEVV